MESVFIHNGDIGTIFRITITDESGEIVDIHTAAVKRIHFQSPSGVKIQRDTEFLTDGYDGKMQYVTVENDINERGVWSVQGYVETTLGKFYTEKLRFNVYESLG